MRAEPRVSVVIPTVSRPRLVVRAVESTLAQSMREIEVVVVIDGPDRMTANALEAIADPRLRVLKRPRRGGAGAARNEGARAATAPWVAFLDDDDLWASEKLAIQLAAAEGSGLAHPIVTCRVAADDGERIRVWPRRLPAPGEPLGDYLLVRRSPFWGEALVHTSTVLADRALLEEVPFREDLLVHEDMDWLLRATRVEGASVVFVPGAEPLATWNIDRGRTRASRDLDWRESLAWARHARPLISRRAYASFLLTWVAAHAARRRDLTALWQLPREAIRHGRPRPRDFLLFMGVWLLPESLRTRAADAWGRGMGLPRDAE
ncbi:MAG TPA: glycosyltransferase family 2 protein [Gemmatimonadota bacterium]|nr:glycosyltransferase family 2 protein [Gemmatimonadota bacterium]